MNTFYIYEIESVASILVLRTCITRIQKCLVKVDCRAHGDVAYKTIRFRNLFQKHIIARRNCGRDTCCRNFTIYVGSRTGMINVPTNEKQSHRNIVLTKPADGRRKNYATIPKHTKNDNTNSLSNIVEGSKTL